MQDVCYIQSVDQAAVLLKPMRLEVLKRLAEPRSCPELAEALGEATQKVYYHVKALEGAGLVDKVSERRVGGIMEGLYQAAARFYWLSPTVVGRVGGQRPARDQMSLDFLLSLAEELQAEVAQLSQATSHTPSLGLSGQIVLRNATDRAAMLGEVQDFFQSMARKYGRRQSDPEIDDSQSLFRLILACYPTPEESQVSNL